MQTRLASNPKDLLVSASQVLRIEDLCHHALPRRQHESFNVTVFYLLWSELGGWVRFFFSGGGWFLVQSLIHPKADLGLFLLRMTFLDSCSSHHQVCVVHGLQHKTAQGRHSGSEPLRLCHFLRYRNQWVLPEDRNSH